MTAPDLKAPPIEPDTWHFETRAGLPHSCIAVLWKKTWFAARAKACSVLGCEPSDVVCVGRPV